MTSRTPNYAANGQLLEIKAPEALPTYQEIGIWTTVIPATLSELLTKYLKDNLTISQENDDPIDDILVNKDSTVKEEKYLAHVRRFVNEKNYPVPSEFQFVPEKKVVKGQQQSNDNSKNQDPDVKTNNSSKNDSNENIEKEQQTIPQKRKQDTSKSGIDDVTSNNDLDIKETITSTNMKQQLTLELINNEGNNAKNKDKNEKVKKSSKTKGPKVPSNTNVYLRVLIASVEILKDKDQVESLLAPFVEEVHTKYPHLYFPGTIELRTTVKYQADSKQESQEWAEKSGWPLMWRGNVKAIPTKMSVRDEQQAVKYTKKLLRYMQDLRTSNESNNNNRSPEIGVLIVDPEQDVELVFATDERDFLHDPLRHAALIAIEQVAAKMAEEEKQEQEGILKQKVISKTTVVTSGSATTLVGGYLCRGYHVYMSHEPCGMCSMGLLHSRISRLVYIRDQAYTGGINYESGGLSIHDQRQLNWKYEAWKYVGDDSSEIKAFEGVFHV